MEAFTGNEPNAVTTVPLGYENFVPQPHPPPTTSADCRVGFEMTNDTVSSSVPVTFATPLTGLTDIGCTLTAPAMPRRSKDIPLAMSSFATLVVSAYRSDFGRVGAVIARNYAISRSYGPPDHDEAQNNRLSLSVEKEIGDSTYRRGTHSSISYALIEKWKERNLNSKSLSLSFTRGRGWSGRVRILHRPAKTLDPFFVTLIENRKERSTNLAGLRQFDGF